MNTADGSNVTVGGGAPGPGGGSGAGPGGGSNTTTPSGEPLKNVKTQLIPYPHPAFLQQESHLPMPSSTTTSIVPTPTSTLSSISYTTIPNNTQIAHVPAPIQLKNPANLTNLFSLNPVAAKITHVKTTIDAANNGGLTLSGLNQSTIVGGAGGATGTIVTGGGLSTVGSIKVGNSGQVATSLSGTPIALNTPQANTSCATSIRAIGAGGQSTQVRVVMGNIMTPSMIKQLENAGPGRTQITAFPTAPARSVSNTSITVTRTATQATYLPRASVTATQMAGVNMSVPAGQRLVTPIRTTPASVSTTGPGATVTGITAAGNFVRGTAVSRSNSSPATTVISPATSTTWMAANPTGQVQLIRAIPHQSRQRIITTQGISGSPVSASGSVATISGTVVTSTASSLQTAGMNNQHQTSNSQQNQGQTTLQTVSAAVTQQQQQTYVATVLPPRHQATLVYSSNVATSQPLNQQQQQFNQSSVGASGPRFAVATPLTGGCAGTAGGPRQIRPIPFAKSFSAAKLNTTSISIRPPTNITSSISGGISNANIGNNNSNSPRSNTVTGVTSTANVLPSTNLSSARIIQLQQQPGGTAQQIIGTTGRLAANVMLQPIIVNTSGTNKLGIRPPVTMAAKVQPSLTITQLGIGKLPSSGVGGGPSSLGQQNMGSGVNTSTGNNSPSMSTAANVAATNLTTNATTQLVNVSQGGQLLTTQNLVTSSAGTTAAGGATVVPLAISTRGAGGSNIITGTMTPIKNANTITVGKVITHAQLNASSSPLENNNTNSSNNAGIGSATNVFIHHAPAPQRPLSNSSTSSMSSGINTSQSAGINVSNTGVTTNVLTSTGNMPAGTFLQPGSTIYYESVPASSVQVSTGVLSLTTTTATSSTLSQNQIGSSAANLSISSLPFSAHSSGGGQSTTATFTVVPSTGGRTIGQLQIPVSNAGGPQIQAVPVRFSHLNAGNLNAVAADAIAVSQSTPQLLQPNAAATCSTVFGGGGEGETSQIIIPAPVAQINAQQTHQMVIPLQTSIKVTSGGGNSANSAVVSNFLRKRDVEGSPIRAAKNLQPTLLSMSSNMISNSSSTNSSLIGSSSYSITPTTSCTLNSSTATLATEVLSKKERSSNTNFSSTSLANLKNNNNTANLVTNRISRAESPASSDGSTTVSANSSPGVEQQIQDNNMIINRLPGGGVASVVDSHFNPINELYSNHQSVVPQQQHTMPGTPVTSHNLAVMEHHNLHQQHHGVAAAHPITIQQRLNGGAIECPPRKKSRRSTNDSQLSTQSQTSLSLPPPQAAITNPPPTTLCQESNVIANGTTAVNAGVGNEVVNGKENTKPVEFILKRPKNCTLMNTYKQSWKSAYNHFQRYSDIKPREERRPTIMDLANQTNVLGKINGWKIFHLKSQMEDLCENESLGYDKLSSMLKQIESNGITNETERISDLLKGNMQRSKIIVDGVSDAQNQIMKIFEHKSHVSDIINRCASKRNYKKREKA